MANGGKPLYSPAQPEPLMTHLAENHEASCQTEKQGRNGENGVPIVYMASSRSSLSLSFQTWELLLF